MTLTQFTNCHILRNHQIIKEDLWVRDGKIQNPERIFFDEKIKADEKIDCKGYIIAPGFIDLQINGGFGIDFSNLPSPSAVYTVAKSLLAYGVTAFCPTVVTSPSEKYKEVLPALRPTDGSEMGAAVLGAHVEGPFINIEKKGAHPQKWIRGFENGMEDILKTYGSLENIQIITLAPELPNATKIIEELSHKKITISVGHSMGDLIDGEKAIQNGAIFITHLFNAMLPFHHRDPGLVGLLTSDKIPKDKTVYFGIIVDGVHTHPAALRIAYKAHPNGLVLVTDAISALGLPEGKHKIGQLDIELRNKIAYIVGTSTLCGSTATMNECVKILKETTGCSMAYALECASLHPAKVLGISDSKGTLNYNADADFVFLNDELELQSTWIAGKCVWKKQSTNTL